MIQFTGSNQAAKTEGEEMQLIRNLFQTLRYLATASAEDRIERQIKRMRFGMTDEERNEAIRKEGARAFWLAMLVLVIALYIIGKLSA